jgi:DNA helicase-2/ATP-dependent DNA helicase PcrA
MDSNENTGSLNLSDTQKKAVSHTGTPLLVTGGPGSGKSCILSHRIVHLITQGAVEPGAILAISFTHNAADKTRNDIASMMGDVPNDLRIGTFSSACCHILNRHFQKIGLDSNFIIYNDNDQLTILKQLHRDVVADKEVLPVDDVLRAIRNYKSNLVNARDAAAQADTGMAQLVADIYTRYTDRLRCSNAMDFQDLILKTVELFDRHPEVLKSYREKIEHLLVDDYQDLNHGQHGFLKRIYSKRIHLCAFGDENQAIHTGDGALLERIIHFERDFPGATRIDLERNFRSTATIQTVTHSILAGNGKKRVKTPPSSGNEGDKIELLETLSEKEEALAVTQRIISMRPKYGYSYRDIAIFYRTDRQSRAIEEALRKYVIPYQIIGGISFFNRKEIKDILAYGKFIVNPQDLLSFQRILDLQHRLGKTTFHILRKKSREGEANLFEALDMTDEIESLSHNTRIRLKKFHELLKKYIDHRDDWTAYETIDALLTETEYMSKNVVKNNVDPETRNQNIELFLETIRDFTETAEVPTLQKFIQEISLLEDIDSWDPQRDKVTLMPLRQAKGLEFPVVFITGVEEGLIPHYDSHASPDALEEERRLFFVGVSRAKERLCLTCARNRRRAGGRYSGRPSRFLKEIPEQCILWQDLIKWERRWGKKKTKSQTILKKNIRAVNVLEDYFKRDQLLEVGKEILHPKLGKGTILGREGFGDDLKVTVKFNGNIEKKLLVRYANFELVENE